METNGVAYLNFKCRGNVSYDVTSNAGIVNSNDVDRFIKAFMADANLTQLDFYWDGGIAYNKSVYGDLDLVEAHR